MSKHKAGMNALLAGLAVLACSLGPIDQADARSRFDGAWNLQFVTQRGSCDASYNFSVNVADGIVTHPNLVKFRGRVMRSGAVTASVTVQDKFASGSGKLSGLSGRGRWNGHDGHASCGGFWTAARSG